MNTVMPVAAASAIPAAPAVAPVAAPSQRLEMASEQPQAQDRAQLGKAVEALNRHFSSMRTDLKFSVDEALNRIIVTVVDAQDGTVLRQIPNEDVLRIARMLEDSPTHLIETQA